MNLYELSAEILSILDGANDEGLDEAIVERLDALEMSRDAKIDQCLAYVRNRAAHAESCRQEARRLTDLARSDESAVSRIKDYVQRCLEMTGTKSLTTPRFAVSLATAPPAVKIADGTPIPDAYACVTKTFNRTAALADWKAGKPLPDCVTVEQTIYLRIR